MNQCSVMSRASAILSLKECSHQTLYSHVVMDGLSCGLLQPKYGGKIIDIVSRDVQRPEDKAQALEDVKGTILYIVIIVVVGYLFFSS